MYIPLKTRLKKILKIVLSFTVYYSGALHFLIYVLSKLKKEHFAAILFYHRFSHGPPNPYHLPHLDVKEFEKQMRHIKKCYKVIMKRV